LHPVGLLAGGFHPREAVNRHKTIGFFLSNRRKTIGFFLNQKMKPNKMLYFEKGEEKKERARARTHTHTHTHTNTQPHTNTHTQTHTHTHKRTERERERESFIRNNSKRSIVPAMQGRTGRPFGGVCGWAPHNTERRGAFKTLAMNKASSSSPPPSQTMNR